MYTHWGIRSCLRNRAGHLLSSVGQPGSRLAAFPVWPARSEDEPGRLPARPARPARYRPVQRLAALTQCFRAAVPGEATGCGGPRAKDLRSAVRIAWPAVRGPRLSGPRGTGGNEPSASGAVQYGRSCLVCLHEPHARSQRGCRRIFRDPGKSRREPDRMPQRADPNPAPKESDLSPCPGGQDVTAAMDEFPAGSSRPAASPGDYRAGVAVAFQAR